MTITLDELRETAILRTRGNLFEDFHDGQRFIHHLGRTLTEGDAIQFSTLTLNYNPLYTNRAFAQAHGHPDLVVSPMLVFNTVLGLSVEDLSEIGGPFVGVFDLTFHKDVYPGATITATSETIKKRRSASNPANGIVTWHTKGYDENGDLVVDYKRSNLSKLRNPDAPVDAEA